MVPKFCLLPPASETRDRQRVAELRLAKTHHLAGSHGCAKRAEGRGRMPAPCVVLVAHREAEFGHHLDAHQIALQELAAGCLDQLCGCERRRQHDHARVSGGGGADIVIVERVPADAVQERSGLRGTAKSRAEHGRRRPAAVLGRTLGRNSADWFGGTGKNRGDSVDDRRPASRDCLGWQLVQGDRRDPGGDVRSYSHRIPPSVDGLFRTRPKYRLLL